MRMRLNETKNKWKLAPAVETRNNIFWNPEHIARGFSTIRYEFETMAKDIRVIDTSDWNSEIPPFVLGWDIARELGKELDR